MCKIWMGLPMCVEPRSDQSLRIHSDALRIKSYKFFNFFAMTTVSRRLQLFCPFDFQTPFNEIWLDEPRWLVENYIFWSMITQFRHETRLNKRVTESWPTEKCYVCRTWHAFGLTQTLMILLLYETEDVITLLTNKV